MRMDVSAVLKNAPLKTSPLLDIFIFLIRRDPVHPFADNLSFSFLPEGVMF